MEAKTLTIPEIALFGGTRVALGVGIGLLLAQRFNKSGRKAAGFALCSVGVLTTIPLLMEILGKPPVASEPVAGL